MNMDLMVGSVGMPVKIQDSVKFGLQRNNKFRRGMFVFAVIGCMKSRLNWVSSVIYLYLMTLVGRGEEEEGREMQVHEFKRVKGKMGDNDPDDKALSFIRVFVYSKIH